MVLMQNPFLIEKAPRHQEGPDIPLFLIHDGGGTIVSYTMIGQLKRTVWGIHNPKFYEGGHWDGGIEEMAEHYTDLIKEAVPEGKPFLLGGWSLGGLLSNQVAHNLAHDRGNRRILGILMIDSPCPLTWNSPRKVAMGSAAFSASTNAEMRTRVATCMKNSGEMLKSWKLPDWQADAGFYVAAPKPPPTVLIRCKEYAPTPEGSDPEAISRVDVAREETSLGWDAYWEAQGFEGWDVLETEGHHYNIFWTKHLDSTSAQIAKGVDLLLAKGNPGTTQIQG